MNPTTDRQRLEFKIAFLQQQLDSLDHYLPETYQYLMEEMDTQSRFFSSNWRCRSTLPLLILMALFVRDLQYIIFLGTGTLESVTVK